MEQVNPETGEITEVAADGGRVAPRAATIADTIRLLADGQFDADVSDEVRKLIRSMEHHAYLNKGASKGQITITLDLSLANGAHVVTPSYKVKLPVLKQPGTLLFADEDGRLGRNPPGQGVLYGVREVTSSPREIRD